MTRPREEQRPRQCAQCGECGGLQLVLTCVLHVYAYRWLCATCRGQSEVRV